MQGRINSANSLGGKWAPAVNEPVILQFSHHPGAWERQLQRRYTNPLLRGTAVTLSQADVNAAQQQDETALEQFRLDFHALLQQAVALEANVDSEVILELKSNVDQLYDHCCTLAGDRTTEKGALNKLLAVLMKSVWNGAGNDVQARTELEQEETARRLHHELLEYPFIADMLQPESPLEADGLVSALLGEVDAVVQAVVPLFDEAQLFAMLDEGRQLLAGLAQTDGAWLDGERRMQLIEAALAQGEQPRLN